MTPRVATVWPRAFPVPANGERCVRPFAVSETGDLDLADRAERS